MLCIPGAGQFYNRQYLKGFAIFFCSVILVVVTWGLSLPIVWVIEVVDALMIAQRLNRGEAVGQWQCF